MLHAQYNSQGSSLHYHHHHKGKEAVSGSQEISQSTWKDFLARVQAADLITKDFKLVCVDSNESVSHGFQVLKEHNISCAPIWDAEKSTYIGFLDMLDIVSLLFSNAQPGEELTHPSKVLDTAIKNANNISDRNPWCPVYIGKPLLSVMDMFSSEGPLHHVPISDEQGNITSIISQSKVVEFLNSTISRFSGAAGRTVEECFTPKQVEYVRTNDSILDAFIKIADTRLYGLAVLDEEGVLVGNISASDLKSTGLDKLSSLVKQPVSMLIKRSSEIFERPFRALYCQKTDTLQQVLQAFTLEHIHRLYIIDSDKKPLGVISLGDIIDVLDKLYL